MQFGLLLAQGIAIVPEVISLKMHVLAGPVLELQLEADCFAASLYNATLALPCLDWVF